MMNVADFFRHERSPNDLVRILKLWLDTESDDEAKIFLIQYQHILVTDPAITIMHQLGREMLLEPVGAELYQPAYVQYHSSVLMRAKMYGLAEAWSVPIPLGKTRSNLRDMGKQWKKQ